MKNASVRSVRFIGKIVLALLLCSTAIGLAALSFTINRHDATSRGIAASSPNWRPDVRHPVLPPALSQPVLATFDWIASFDAAALQPRRITAMRGAMSRRQSQRLHRGRALPVVSDSVAAISSPALRDLPPADVHSVWVEQPEPRTPTSRLPQLPRNPASADPVVQRSAPTAALPAVGQSFEGMNITQSCGNCLPPDPNGAVGPNHYVQMVNSDIAVYSKTGATLMAPKAINMLWSSTPNSECATHNNGDPIVLYDQLADRWMVSQFVVQATTENYAQCIAVSQTADPTGAYYLYEFDESPDTFHDYPHLGVWPDGYYMSTNQFPNDTTGTVAAGAWVFERPKMILGQPARYVFFDETPLAENCNAGECTYAPFGQLPSTLDGRNPPPAGTPNFFVEVDDVNQPDTPPATTLHDEMHIWKFHVDWTDPTKSSFGVGSTAPAQQAGAFSGQFKGNAGQPDFILPIADYLASACQIENGPNDCTPEKVNPPQPAQYLDVLGDRLMFRLVYRNFGDHDALVVNHTVDVADVTMGGNAASAPGRNGIRWYEVRNVSTTPAVYQQGTFAPLDDMTNPLWRWMGSAAFDHSGNIGVGYSASGPNYFPSLHLAGRFFNDPLGELSQGEEVLFAGLGIEANTGIFPFRNRWGDYSAITVDPNDDCTFWYTNEYLAPNSPTDILPVDWHTRIVSVKFPTCAASPAQLVSVVSRLTHTDVGPLDINMPLLGAPGIECRIPAATGNFSHNYTLVFTFANVVTNCGTVSGATGSATVGTDPHQCVATVSLSNQKYTTVTLQGVHDSSPNPFDAGVTVGVLVGDADASGHVDANDITVVQGQNSKSATANPRADIDTSGHIDAGDIGRVQAANSQGF